MMATVLISAPSFRYDWFLNRHISRGADTNHVPSMLSYWLLWWRWGHKQTPVLGEEPSTTNQSSASARDQDITVRVGFVVHIRLVPSFLPTWHPDIMMASSTLTSHHSYCPGTPSLHLLPFNSTPVLHSCQLRFLLSQRKSNQVQTSATRLGSVAALVLGRHLHVGHVVVYSAYCVRHVCVFCLFDRYISSYHSHLLDSTLSPPLSLSVLCTNTTLFLPTTTHCSTESASIFVSTTESSGAVFLLLWLFGWAAIPLSYLYR